MQRNLTARMLALALCLACGPLTACSPAFWGGAAVGAVGAGAAYEHRNAKAMRELDRALERGDISKEEYLKRKEELEKSSVVR
jgi:uncharacterized membrane protein